MQAADRAAFLEAFSQLSERSRFLRFASPKPRLSEREIRFLVEVDHHDHEALVAFECETRAVVAVARFVRLRGEPDVAEVAVTVLDGWQGLGIGTALLGRLAERAAEEGLAALVANVLPENVAARAALRRAGFTGGRWEDGMLQLRLDLRPASSSPLERAVEAA